MNNSMPLRPVDDRLPEEDLSSLISGTQVPEDVSSSWRTAIRKETEMKKIKRFPWKSTLSVAAAAVVLLMGVGLVRDMDLGARQTVNNSTYSYSSSVTPTYLSSAKSANGAVRGVVYEDYAVESAEEAAVYAAAVTAGALPEAVPEPQMMVYTASVNLTTPNFAEDLAALQARVTELGGYTEYLRQTGDVAAGQRRGATLTVRVPAGALEEFLNAAKGLGRVTSSSLSTENVTDSYTDLATRLSSLEAKRTRLNELIGTTAKLTDLLELESEISDTQYQIERIQGQMNSITKQVAYSSVTVYLTEETATSAAQTVTLSLGERIAKAFEAGLEGAGDFLEDALVFLVMAAPILLPLAAVIILIVVIVKKRRAKKNG